MKREGYLVADIGGTNTRIAIGDRAGSLAALRTYANDRLDDLEGALRQVADELAEPRRAVIAAAGPADGDRLQLTNRDWSLSRTGLTEMLGLRELLVVNDFVAMAHSVPALRESDLAWTHGRRGDFSKNILVCGPGTGFGAAALIRTGDRSAAVATEAGHISLGAVSREEMEVFARLSTANTHLAVENVLSGRGLAALHKAITGIDLPSEKVIAQADETEEAASKTVAFFMRVIGRVVGDLALAFDARGGIFIGGGVGHALRGHFARAAFRQAFVAHPPYEDRLRDFPVAVILHRFPGLIGALEIARTEYA